LRRRYQVTAVYTFLLRISCLSADVVPRSLPSNGSIRYSIYSCVGPGAINILFLLFYLLFLLPFLLFYLLVVHFLFYFSSCFFMFSSSIFSYFHSPPLRPGFRGMGAPRHAVGFDRLLSSEDCATPNMAVPFIQRIHGQISDFCGQHNSRCQENYMYITSRHEDVWGSEDKAPPF
jgi:hypothetical protein